MSATRLPQKFKRGRKRNVNVQTNSSCRFCEVNFTSGGGRASFENLFWPPWRVESAGPILAHCCRSIERVNQKRNLSQRVCRPCCRKTRNAAQLYSFIERAVSNTIVEEDLHWEAVEDRSKRELLTTITPERSDVRKKRLKSDGEQMKEKSPGKFNSKKTLFAESSTVSDSSNAESGIASIETFYTQTPEQVTLTLAGQDADILLNYCSIENITGNPSTPISLRQRHWFWILTGKSAFGKCLTTRRTLTEIASLVCWTTLSYCLINQSEFADAGVRRGEQNRFIIAGVPFLPSPIPSPFFPPSFFSFLPSQPPPLTPATQASENQPFGNDLLFLFFFLASLFLGNLRHEAQVFIHTGYFVRMR